MSAKLVHGVGINDADYAVTVHKECSPVNGKRKQRRIWSCPFYRTWADMLTRAYSEKEKARHPTYKDVTVCKEWHTFSVFKAWMEVQDFESGQLDKDLLVTGNKHYSPETCVFVSKQVNMFLVDSGATRGNYLIGASWCKRNNKFKSQCRNPITRVQETLGYFTTEQEAHEAWLAKKLEHSHTLASLQTDIRIAEALIRRYENYNGGE